jgi:hypothetical protein
MDPAEAFGAVSHPRLERAWSGAGTASETPVHALGLARECQAWAEPSVGAGRAGRESPGATVFRPGAEEQQAAQG